MCATLSLPQGGPERSFGGLDGTAYTRRGGTRYTAQRGTSKDLDSFTPWSSVHAPPGRKTKGDILASIPNIGPAGRPIPEQYAPARSSAPSYGAQKDHLVREPLTRPGEARTHLILRHAHRGFGTLLVCGRPGLRD